MMTLPDAEGNEAAADSKNGVTQMIQNLYTLDYSIQKQEGAPEPKPKGKSGQAHAKA